MSYFGSIKQDVIADNNNSTSANINAGETWSGSATSTLGIAGIQVNIKSSQNCIVYVDQSMGYGENWDITDTYNYYYSLGGNSWTTQATASLLRVRVKNVGTSATTYCRVETTLCPIVEVLPRSLTDEGQLKVTVLDTLDDYGYRVQNTPTDETRVVIPYRLIGSTFDDSNLDSNFWTASSGTSGTVSVTNAECILSTGLSANNIVTLQTNRIARYVGGISNRYRSVVRTPDTGTANNIRRWGAFSTTDGAFYELSGTDFRLVTRKNSVDTVVSNGSFNGKYGTYLYPIFDTNVKTYEIYWTNSKVWFSYSGELLHVVQANTETWASTMNLPCRFENFNINNSTSNVSLYTRVSTIHRLGHAVTQPLYKYISGQTAGTLCKRGAGNLHSVLIGSQASTSVITIYDGISTAGSIIFSFTYTQGTQSNNQPFNLDFKGVPFNTGLFVVIATANANITLMYE